MNTNPTTKVILLALAALGTPMLAHAAPASWGTWNAVTDNTAIQVLGGYTTVEGVNFNGSTTIINNGTTDVTFAGIAHNGSGSAAGITVANSSFGFQSTGNNSNVTTAVGSPQTWATVLDRVIGGAPGTITLSGPDLRQQLLHTILRSAPDANILADSKITSGGVDSPFFGNHAGGGTKSIIATFTADGTSQVFTVSGEEPTYSALVIGVQPAGGDTTPPTITGADITDDVSGGPILVNHGTVTYTLTFSEAMDAASITTADFENFGSATAGIDQVNTTGNPAVFEVEITPSTVGTLILQIKAGETLEDLAGNNLDTTLAIADSTTITVDPLPPSPPVITDVTPDDDSFSVPLTTDLVIVFDETVQKGTGNIYVRTGASAVQTIDVTTGAVTLSTTTETDDTVTVDISDLIIDTDYAIQIDARAFEDTESTGFTGIGDDTTWNFSTGTPPPSSIVSFGAVNGTTGPNTPPILDNTYGTLEMALNLGGASITYDGIGFTGNTVTSGTNVVTWATVGGISVGGTTDVGATWNTATNIVSGSPGGSGEYNATFGTEAWSNKSGGGTFQTINITGLDAGKSYQIQLMHGEDRSIGNGFDYAGTLVATDDNSNTADVFFRFGDENDQNTYVFGLVTLVVSGTTSVDILYPDRSVAASGDRDPSIAGIVIHSATGGPVNPYGTWAADNAPTGNPDDDFDGDGVSNAVEFVLGGDKDTNDLGKLPTVGASGGNMTFSFVRDQSSIDPSTVVVSIEVSTDLATWDTAPSPYAVPDTATVGPPVEVVDNADGTDTVTLTVTQAPDTKKFARLKVAIAP